MREEMCVCAGFIVVASCVMTFEARDSAAKVVPARYKLNNTASVSHGHGHQQPQPGGAASTVAPRQSSVRGGSARRTAGCQTRWDAAGLGLYQHAAAAAAAEVGASPSGSDAISRRALTAAFVQFSRALQHRQPSTESAGSHGRLGPPPHHVVPASLGKSPSAPNLCDRPPSPQPSPSPTRGRPRRPVRPVRTSLRPSCAFLSPRLLQRQALSMDNPGCRGCGCRSPPLGLRSGRSTRSGSRESLELGASAGVGGSQASMAMDLHLPDDCPVTLSVRDQSRRSDTARRHPLMRQRPVEDEAVGSPRGRVLVRADTELLPAPRCRANTADCSRRLPPQRSGSLLHGSVKLNYSRSNVDDYRHRRESICSELGRRPRRASLSKANILRVGAEGMQPLPYTISRPVIEGGEHRTVVPGHSQQDEPCSLQELRVRAPQASSDSADTQVTRLSLSSHNSRQQLHLDLLEAAPQPASSE
ncbi:hypothetical protein PR048_022575 [Dryococelus australis]|uniref:Uncharacterized protein n=1 Tax=Dryococelus australis TaxID=614101 RepID=A0ABQ9H1Q0_9NEOP|nr:hypothetical protein PR048_022575 [Dryococelus australis]